MEKQTKVVVDQQSCQEVEGNNTTYLVEKIEAKQAKIDSLLIELNEWENEAVTSKAQAKTLAEELAATKSELQKQQAATNEWENRAIKAEEALKKANSGTWWKFVLGWIGSLIVTTIVGKAVENGSPKTINKTSSLFPIDEILSVLYEYAATLWRATRVFLGL